jgi:hypothetical protein
MHDATPQVSATTDDDDARLESLGYQPQLSRVLGLFSNFSVAFIYLSPIVGVFSLVTIGLGIAGPPGAAGHAARADLGRRRVVHHHRRAAAVDPGQGRHRRGGSRPAPAPKINS